MPSSQLSLLSKIIIITTLLAVLWNQAKFNATGDDYGGEHQVGGRTLEVNFPEVPLERLEDSPNKIYAGNLEWGLTSQALRDAFAEPPCLLSAKVIYERDNGTSCRYGFVSFETAEDVEAALSAMNGVEVQRRPLRLNLAAVKKPSSPVVIDEKTRS